MNEQIFNLFLLINDGNIYKLGAVSHNRNGTDQDKLAFLQAKVSTDVKNMKLFQLPDRYEFVEQGTNNRIAGLKYDTFKILASTGQHLEVFEEVFQDFEASVNPLVCITPIVENKPKVDKQEYFDGLEDQNKRKFQKITESAMPDYLTAYITKDGFDAPRLFNDDYFLAIKLLYKNKHYTSSLKLLMSFIDTVAYLEYGDISRNFQKWLDQYADLSQVGVNASELWEFRNSLLHMTNC